MTGFDVTAAKGLAAAFFRLGAAATMGNRDIVDAAMLDEAALDAYLSREFEAAWAEVEARAFPAPSPS